MEISAAVCWAVIIQSHRGSYAATRCSSTRRTRKTRSRGNARNMWEQIRCREDSYSSIGAVYHRMFCLKRKMTQEPNSVELDSHEEYWMHYSFWPCVSSQLFKLPQEKSRDSYIIFMILDFFALWWYGFRTCAKHPNAEGIACSPVIVASK